MVLRGNRVEEFDFEFGEQEAAARQYLPRQGHSRRAVPPGCFRRLWRQSPRFSRLLRNSSGLLSDSGRRSTGAARRGSPVPARGGRRGEQRKTQPPPSAPASTGGRGPGRRGREPFGMGAGRTTLGRTNSPRRRRLRRTPKGIRPRPTLIALVCRRKRFWTKRARSRPEAARPRSALPRILRSRAQNLPSPMRRRSGRRPFKLQLAPRRAAKAPKPLDRRTSRARAERSRGRRSRGNDA